MSSEYVIVEKQDNSDRIKEFVSHYQLEMSKNINSIRNMIEIVRKNNQDCNVFQEIKNKAHAISDLAMVYGYEGVETIGNRIVQSISNIKQNSSVENLISIVEDAIMAVESAMFLIDERKERELIRDLSMRKVDTEKKTENEDQFEEISDKENEFPLFDIREDEKLISLLSDTDGQAIEISQTKTKNCDNDTIEVDFNSILEENYPSLDFDIPNPSLDTEDREVEDSILEIDFKGAKSIVNNDNRGLLQKISSLLGLKGKN